MDWMEKQVPPPSWHDEGDIPKDLDDELHCPLSSVVRRCYLNHLEQTLLHNYRSCRTHTIQESTLQDLILHWEQNALRACMMTTIYQKAMRQLINAIKADTKLNKLTPVLTATIKKSQRQHAVDASTQTDSGSLKRTPKTREGFDSKHHFKRERTVTRESADGPFLTPPSDYPVPTQTAKRAACRQLPFPPQDNASDSAGVHPPFGNPPCPVPFPFAVPPPGYQFLPQQMYTNNWPMQENMEYAVQSMQECFPPGQPCFQPVQERFQPVQECFQPAQECFQPAQECFQPAQECFQPMQECCQPVPESFQPISVITNVCSDVPYNERQAYPEVPEQETTKTDPIPEDVPMKDLFGGGGPADGLRLGPSDAAEPDYNWDQIEEEMARLYGQAFTEDDGKAASDDTEPEPEMKAVQVPIPVPIPVPKETDDVDLELLGRLHEAQLQARLQYIRQHWTLERQAKLKRRFVELFGREDEEDLLVQVSPKQAAKCKQRIAPWIVKHLMPLYKEKRIASRHVFKSLAKHISDLLIQRNLHPDECDVWMGVQEFFSGGTTIECEADFSA